MRTSFWRRTFAHARQTDGWFVVDKLFTAKTAKQTASDIRSGRRVVGMEPGEQWDAVWYRTDDRFQNSDAIVKILKVAP